VEGVVFLTHDMSSENVPVFLIYTEVEDAAAPGGGGVSVRTVPVGEGELPADARVRVTRTDAGGHFLHPQHLAGGVTLRVGTLPSNCRRPRDLRAAVDPGQLSQVRIDVLCYGPKADPPSAE
jgi:hypothetical protein